jgi:lipopolysaccharide/colanic/teichoic acid biosynthesis glycosyltransferase
MGHATSDPTSPRRRARIPAQPTADDRQVPPPEEPAGTTQAAYRLDHQHGRVAEAVLAPPLVVRTAPTPSPRPLGHRPRALLTLHVLTVLSGGVTVAAAIGVDAWTACAVLTLSLVIAFHEGHAAIRPGLPHLGRMATNMALPYAAVGVAVGFAGADPASLRDAAALIAVVVAVDVGGTLLRRRIQRPVRVIVVGDHDAIADAARRWTEDRSADRCVKVVGGLLLNDTADNPPVSHPMGIRTIRGIEEAVEWVDLWAADAVVVAPGPGVTSESVRRLSWLLERTGVALAVMGVLDSVAPHRIDATVLAGATLIHARSSRPSAYIRSTKWVLDRLLGSLLLALCSPLLAVLWLWVRLDSPGPGFFAQTRAGQDGRPFRMYKLRTMRCDAEALKSSLATRNEGHGVLFKLRHDPRITRPGRFLRKASLDELPQLLNVVLGQMSLVGPRPALPGEVSRYDERARRRLAVRPGMTGLWQVNGRSDLSGEESVELVLRYTDNYRLTDDLLIGLRTFDAVCSARGAY